MFRQGKWVVLGALGFALMGSANSCQNNVAILADDEGVSNAVLADGQEVAPAYRAKNFTVRRSKNEFDLQMDRADLTGYVVVTQPGVERPLLYTPVFGACFDDSVQTTNPQQWFSSGAVVALPEPGTGLYTGTNGSGATNCITEDGVPFRTEQQVFYSAAPIELNAAPMLRIATEKAKYRVDIEKLRRDIREGRKQNVNQ